MVTLSEATALVEKTVVGLHERVLDVEHAVAVHLKTVLRRQDEITTRLTVLEKQVRRYRRRVRRGML